MALFNREMLSYLNYKNKKNITSAVVVQNDYESHHRKKRNLDQKLVSSKLLQHFVLFL